MGQVCFLFGQREVLDSVTGRLEDAVEQMIRMGVDRFVVGSHSLFDRVAAQAVSGAKERHGHVSLLRLLPGDGMENETLFDGCWFPRRPAQVPDRFVQHYASQKILESCDSVICFVNGKGNPQILLAIARRRGIPVLNVCDGGTGGL